MNRLVKKWVWWLIMAAAVSIPFNLQAEELKSVKKIDAVSQGNGVKIGKTEKHFKLLQGEILRFYETRAGEWSSSLLVKDFSGKEHTVFVEPTQTLVKRGPQIEDLAILTGGMKITMLVRKVGGQWRAATVRIDGGFYG